MQPPAMGCKHRNSVQLIRDLAIGMARLSADPDGIAHTLCLPIRLWSGPA